MHTVVFHIHFDSILLWGLAGTVVLTVIMQLSQGLGLSRISLPFMMGTVFTANRDWAQILGFGFYFLGGWMFALLYAMLFESLGWASWWLGSAFGLVHGLFMLAILMPLLPSIHPRMANENTMAPARRAC